jgi:hypothetical protein
MVQAAMNDIAEKSDDVVSAPAPQEIRKAIFDFQAYLATLPSCLDECVVRHIFAPGCYAREMTIPKGVYIIGKIHRHAHVNIISKGSVSVMTEFGPKKMSAPHTFVSEVGTKRVVRADEETVWTTIHVTNETDLEKIEDYVIAKSYDELGLLDPPKADLIEGKAL